MTERREGAFVTTDRVPVIHSIQQKRPRQLSSPWPIPDSIAIAGSAAFAAIVASFAALLAAALLMAVALRLLGLSAAALPGFALYLPGPAHVVAILFILNQPVRYRRCEKSP